MSNDIVVLRDMLTRSGVVFREDQREAGETLPDTSVAPAGTTINIAAETPGPRNYGYPGMFAEFYFDDHGALIGVGAWE